MKYNVYYKRLVKCSLWDFTFGKTFMAIKLIHHAMQMLWHFRRQQRWALNYNSNHSLANMVCRPLSEINVNKPLLIVIRRQSEEVL